MEIFTCFSPNKLEVLGLYFGIGSGSTTERIITRAIKITAPTFKREFVPENIKMNRLIKHKIILKNFPECHHATDATVQQRNRPTKTFE